MIEGQPYLGEYVPLRRLLAVLKRNSMIWNVMGHDGQCCQFVPHNEVYSIY